MNKQTLTIIISAVLVIVAFFGGKAYGSHHPSASLGQAGSTRNAQFARGMMSGTGGGAAFGGTRGGNTAMGQARSNDVVGQVVSKDVNSIIVSVPNNGGSKIILYTPSTIISKSTMGTLSDVTVGASITAVGTTNTDGSITASNIQIRPTP